jgi:energy-coupling factor transporter ATP-binding protein EcfA2
MIKRITLENYMSHARTVIEPAAGLTVLVGPNNCGKSAVVSALQTLCGDNAGDFMVRHGERVCQVTVETDDGHEITWRRKGQAVMYVIDGREIHRSGRGNLPDDLHEHLRLPKVEAGATGEPFDVHFALQKSPIFLIGPENEGRAAAFFSTSSDAERLLEVQKLHKAKVTDTKSKQKLLSAELTRLDQQLQSLSPLEGVDGSLHSAEEEYERLAKEGEEIAARAKLNRSIAQWEEEVAVHRRRNSALRGLAIPPELGDDQRLGRHCAELSRVYGLIDRYRAEHETLAALPAPPAMAQTQTLEGLIVLLAGLEGSVGGTRRRNDVLNGLEEPPQVQQTAPLASIVEKFVRAEAEVARVRRSLNRLQAESDGVIAEVQRWSRSNPTCPVCGAITDAERILAEDHAHA